MDAPYMAAFTGARLYGSSSTLNIARGAGLPENAMEQYQPGKPLHFGKFTVTILNSKHTPALKILGAKDDVGENITSPLHQPAKLKEYKEGGAYDILIQHGKHSILIKASTNFIPEALDSVHADVLFLGVATLSKQDTVFQNNYYAQTVSKVHPQILIPIHWDNFFTPLSNNLKPYPKLADNVKKDFNFLIRKTGEDKIRFRIMEGFERVVLF
jgi:L-ascorbate metabolism protein UlaG (beta-lactamase superfamily)